MSPAPTCRWRTNQNRLFNIKQREKRQRRNPAHQTQSNVVLWEWCTRPALETTTAKHIPTSQIKPALNANRGWLGHRSPDLRYVHIYMIGQLPRRCAARGPAEGRYVNPTTGPPACLHRARAVCRNGSEPQISQTCAYSSLSHLIHTKHDKHAHPNMKIATYKHMHKLI